MTPRAAHRKVTLKDVARAAEVHVSTASRALDPTKSWRISDQTVARVQLAAERLGYTPDMVAKGLKSGMAMMVGVIVADFENPFIGPIIRGISDEVEESGLVALVTETLEDHDRLDRELDHLLSRRVNAIVLTAARASDRHLLTRFALRVPAFVLAVRNVDGSDLPYVTQDDYRGGKLAAQHLIDLGHTAVAQLRGPDDIEPFANRTAGFRRAVGSRGLIDVTVNETVREVTLAEGRRLMAMTLDSNADNPPTAVFAHADLLAIGAIEEMQARDLRCPEDISIVGYDDAPLVGHVRPPLSTIRLPGLEIGHRAGRMVMDLIKDPKAPVESASLPATLVPRASTAPPGQKGNG